MSRRLLLPIVVLGTLLVAPAPQAQAPEPPACLADLNGNGLVNQADVDLVKAQLGKKSGQAGYEPVLDIDDDGQITSKDVKYVVDRLGQRCSEQLDCRADINTDGLVNRTDLDLVKASLGKRAGQPGYNPAADFDGNGVIDQNDITFVNTRRWGACSPCRADVNGDGVVGKADYLIVVGSYRKKSGDTGFNPNVDFDGSGAIGHADLLFVTRRFGLRCPSPGPLNHSPTANAGGPYTGVVGSPVSFTGSATDPDSDPLTFTWNFGDNTPTQSGASATHVYQKAGKYTAVLTASDGKGGTDSRGAAVTITSNNHPPSANAGGPYVGAPNVAVRFNGSGSDPDNDPLTFSWKFGDGSTGTGATPSHAYKKTGKYTVTLTVSDGRGGADSKNAPVTISTGNHAPTANPGGPYSGTAGQAISFTGSGTDPDNNPLTFTWNFGDGTPTATGATQTHAYANAGDYVATLTVSDGKGGTDSKTAPVKIAAANRKPTANPGGPYSGSVSHAVDFAGSGSDPDNDPLTFSWEFGDQTPPLGSATPSHIYQSAGTFTAALTVSDGRGGTDRREVTVTIASGNANPSITSSPVTSAQHSSQYRYQIVASDTDGDALTYRLTESPTGMTIGAAGLVSWVPTGPQIGDQAVALAVTDGHGGTATQAFHINVVDVTAPKVALAAPRVVLPGSEVTITAQADDNVGVQAVDFAVEGATLQPTGNPSQRMLMVPPVAQAGAHITARATAQDAAGNSASAEAVMTIVTTPDTENPAVVLHVPSQGAPGAKLRFSAGATDDGGIQTLSFLVDDAPIATLTAPPFEATFDIPASAAPGSQLAVMAKAIDYAGNHAEATGAVVIVSTPDATTPVVTLSAPSTAAPGGTVHLIATATDDSGIASLAFLIDGVRVATFTEGPYDATISIATGLTVGSDLRVEARAVSGSNLEGSESALVHLIPTPAAGQGVIVGEAYDDKTSLPLGGVLTTLTGAGAQSQTTTTDERGRFVFLTNQGTWSIRLEKAGWTRVDRSATIGSGEAIEVLDARLSPLGAAQNLSSVFGGNIGANGTTLTVAPGVLPADLALTVVQISGQGLEAPLPIGWSPAAVVDVWPHGVTFAGTAQLATPNALGLAQGSLIVARWDEQGRAWRSIRSVQVADRTAPLNADIPGTGQYAFLLPDVQPSAPPLPAPGDAVNGVAAALLPADVTAVVEPQPKILFYKPGIQSLVTGKVTPQAPISSGARVISKITESYTYRSGQDIHPDSFVEDLILYQSGNAAGLMAASYPVTPSLTFDPLALDKGVITVELRAPAAGGSPLTVIGVDGGAVSAPTGERLDFPSGAGATAIPVSIEALTLGDLGLTLPDTLQFIGAVRVSFPGTLDKPATLSVSRPATVNDVDQVLVALAEEIDNATRLVLVARGLVAQDRITSAIDLGSDGTALEGILKGGRYLVLRATVPVGFSTGNVTGISDAPFTGAIVSSGSLPLIALSRSVGQYASAVRTGAVTLTALDPQKRDEGRATGNLSTAGAVIPLNLRLTASTPRVTSIVPVDGASNVALAAPVVVTFSKSLDPASVTGANSGNVVLAGPDAAPIAGAITFDSTGSVLTFRPTALLSANTRYTVTLKPGIADPNGRTLTPQFTSSFVSLDTNPPSTPAAGTITASIPDTTGTTTVTGTQGTAGPHDTVSVLNLTKGTVTPVIVDPNGGFLARVTAALGDKLRLRIVDEAGNETTADIDGFRQVNADGSLSAAVDAKGGVFEGPGGASVDIPEGVFTGSVVVTIKSVTAQDIPVTFTDEERQRFQIVGGLTLDFGGARPSRYVNVSIPAKGDEAPDAQWVVAHVVDLNGRKALDIFDTAKLKDGRITTSSPPFEGETDGGMITFVASTDPIGVVHGRMYSNGGGMIANLVYVRSSELAIPMIVLSSEVPARTGFPFPTDRITIVPNSTRLTIQPFFIAPTDRELVVYNRSMEQSQSFPLNPLDYRVDVPGSIADGFDVGFNGPLGGGAVPSVRVSSGQPGMVTLRLNPDRLTKPVSEVTVKNRLTNDTRSFPFSLSSVSVGVDGDVDDPRDVRVTDVNGAIRSLLSAEYQLTPSTYGSGNLLARALPNTIDPDRQSVQISKVGGGGALTVPDSAIVNGGFAFAFDGDPLADYVVIISFNNRPPLTIAIPRFRITAVDARTGQVVRTISGFVPPRDEPIDIGDITDDVSSPYVISGPTRIGSFDPLGVLTFTFSEMMDPDSLKEHIVVRDSHGNIVKGQVRVSGGNRVATFVPDNPLRMGEQYTITLDGGAPIAQGGSSGGSGSTARGIRDAAGNQLTTLKLKVTTFTPKIVGTLANGAAFKDLAIRHAKVAGRLTTTLFATTGALSENLLAIDATDPKQPTVTGINPGANSRQRVAFVPGVSFTDLNGQHFSGDVAVTSTFNVNSSSLAFVDVTNQSQLNLLGTKVLTVNPDLRPDSEINVNSPNTLYTNGYAKGVAAIQTTTGLAAYVAVDHVGLMASDIAQNVPQRLANNRIKEPIYSGEFADVVAHNGQLFTITSRPSNTLQILSLNFAPVGSAVLPFTPRRLRVIDGLQTDLNGDGQISQNEVLSLAVIGADSAIVIVDVRNTVSPQVIGVVQMPGSVRDLEADAVTRRIFAGVDQGAGGPALLLIDLSKPATLTSTDSDGDGLDDRVIWSRTYAPGFNGVRLDGDRGLLYVAHPGGLDIWAVYDSCCDLGVDLTTTLDNKADGNSADLFVRERKALQTGIAAGLTKAIQVCSANPDDFRMFESGSSACLWDADPEKSCDGNYQPGVSDHDVSLFFPDSMWETRVGGELQATCVVNQLADQFTDDNKRPKPVRVPAANGVPAYEFFFGDISFIPNRLAQYRDGLYDVFRSDPALKGDAINDLGLGRQLLVLKHVTESRWVDLDAVDSSLKGIRNDEDGALAFETILAKLREVTHIPHLEGFEWANLMEYNLAKGQGFIRVRGASDEASSLHDFYIGQLHLAGKAGIRAALARLIADPQANPRTVDLVRFGDPLTVSPVDPNRDSAGRRERLVFTKNACLFVDKNLPPQAWATKPCNSLEEYMASAAAWTLRPWRDQGKLSVFTYQDVVNIYRFFQVKSDRVSIKNDDEADAFMATAAAFVQRVKRETQAIYNQEKNTAADPWKDTFAKDEQGTVTTTLLRDDNLAKKEEVLQKANAAHVQLIPHVFNRSYRDGANVRVAMYHTPAGGGAQALTETQLTVEGGDNQYLEWLLDENGQPVLNAKKQKTPLFEVEVNQATQRGSAGTVVFTIDLPDRTVRESDRSNNSDGFTYYVLDPPTDFDRQSGATVPKPSLPPPVTPFPALSGGDPECAQEPTLEITQELKVGSEFFESPVTLALQQPATLELTVKNISQDAVDDVTACSSLTSECYSLGTIASGAEKTQEVPFSSAKPIIVDAIPTVYSGDSGIQTASPFRIVVGCEEYAVVPLAPDPNALSSQYPVGRGGVAVRYFRVVDTKTGQALANASVQVVVAMAGQSDDQGILKTFRTNADGLTVTRIPTGIDPMTGNPKFEERLGIELPLPDTAPKGTKFGIKVTSVNGVAPVCNPAVETDAYLEDRAPSDTGDRSFTKSFTFGASLEGSVGLGVQFVDFGASGATGRDGGLTRRLFVDQGGEHEHSIEATASAYTEKGISGGIHIGLSKSVGPIDLDAELFDISGTYERRSTKGASFGFGPSDSLDDQANCELVTATLVSFFGDVDNFGDQNSQVEFKKLGQLAERGCDPSLRLTRLTSQEARSTTVELKAGLSASLSEVPKQNPDEKQRKIEATLQAGVEGDSAILETFERNLQLDTPTSQLVQTGLTEQYELKAGLDYRLGLDAAISEVKQKPDKFPSTYFEEKFDHNFNALERAMAKLESNAPTIPGRDEEGNPIQIPVTGDLDPNLKPEISGRFGDTYGVSFEWDTSVPGNPLAAPRPRKVSVSYAGGRYKGWSFIKPNEPSKLSGGKPSGSRTFVFSNPEDIDRAIGDPARNIPGLASLNSIKSGFLVFVPTVISTEFGKFLDLLFETSPYYEDKLDDEDALEVNIGGKLGLAISKKIKAEASLNLQARMNSRVEFNAERGVVVGGESFALERYPRSLFPNPNAIAGAWDVVTRAWDVIFDKNIDNFPQATETIQPLQHETIHNGSHSTLTVGPGAVSEPVDVTVIHTSYETTPGPVADKPRSQTAISGPAEPHVGTGGYTRITPSDVELESPATLELFYDAADAAQDLAAYVWNEVNKGWDYVGGQVDSNENKLIVEIPRFGLYTLAPPLPTAKVVLTATPEGGASNQFVVTSDPIVLNNGTPAPDGTRFSVRTTATGDLNTPFGSVVGDDADPLRDGFQIVTQGGRLQFTVEFPTAGGTPVPAFVAVFGAPGPAFGSIPVNEPVQP